MPAGIVSNNWFQLTERGEQFASCLGIDLLPNGPLLQARRLLS
jgi:hypothetical protein